MLWTAILRIAAVSTRPMAIEEVDSEHAWEVRKTHGSASPGDRDSTDPIPQPDETLIAQRSTPDLVWWSEEPGGVLVR